jgi:putative transposase
MTGPTRRREAVAGVRRQLPVSERRACRTLGQPRSTQRYRPKRRDEESAVVRQMHEMVRRHPRYGYRRIWAMLRAEGWRVNVKRIYRLWRREGFRVPRRQRKKRRLGCSDNGIVRRQPEYKNHVWTWDFVHDRDERTRPLKWFVLMDEYTRECLALEVERSMKAVDVIDVLSQVLLIRGVPRYIRSDNGPEFIARAMRRYLETAEVGALYIEPGAPWENGYAESFFSRLRDELLNRELFADLADAQALAASWQNDYNHRRPHSSLGYLTPAAYAQRCRRTSADEFGGSAPKPPASKPPRKAPGKKKPEAVHHGQTLIVGGT